MTTKTARAAFEDIEREDIVDGVLMGGLAASLLLFGMAAGLHLALGPIHDTLACTTAFGTDSPCVQIINSIQWYSAVTIGAGGATMLAVMIGATVQVIRNE